MKKFLNFVLNPLFLVILPISIYCDTDKLQEQIDLISKKMIAAQEIDDEKTIENLNKQFEKILEENPDLKDAFIKFNEISKAILIHKEKANLFFENKEYSLAIKEYYLILELTKEKKNNFKMHRSEALLKIGNIYYLLGEESFKCIDNENLLPSQYNLFKKMIKKIKSNFIKSKVLDQNKSKERILLN
ncbi:MAG: hypothetical protein KAI43_01800 [Candidatus Aureabacteria bacterium]|nr:hypothetical protein [Candidatus Auribacterota bacterium]